MTIKGVAELSATPFLSSIIVIPNILMACFVRINDSVLISVNIGLAHLWFVPKSNAVIN